jgi:CDP-glycerol glycerophosphotransferase
MNKSKYNADRLSLFLFSIFGMILSVFIKYDNRRIIFNSFQNNKYNSNSKYLFLWFIKNVKDYRSYFVINNDILRNELNSAIGNYFIETKTLKGKLFALQAKIWIISTLELPVGCIFAKHKRYVIHLGHGTPIKNIGLLEKNVSLIKKIYYYVASSNISHALAPSEYFKTMISQFINLPLENILIAGHARNDQLFVKSNLNIQKITKQQGKNILYAPTWRQSTKLKLFPFDDLSCLELSDFLDNNKINVFLRVHPNFEEKIDPELLAVKNIYVFSGKVYDEIMDYLNLFDLLITDYSSIYFDFLLLDRPIIFLTYDYEQYNKEIGFPFLYNELTPGYKPSTMKEFMKAILDSFDRNIDLYKNERMQINSICNAFKHDNCKEFVKLLYEKNILS